MAGTVLELPELCTGSHLAPVRRVKLAAVYLSMTLLCLIFAVLLVRSLLALVTWVALGRCLWLFPYLLSEVLPRPCPFGTRLVSRSIIPAATSAK